MSAPRHIFIDTSVFDRYAYNFSCEAFTSLVEASKTSKLTLVIPAAVEAEIQRHISESATEAARTLEGACRKAPYLAKWDLWPLKKDDRLVAATRLHQLARSEYEVFKKQFSVVLLDYKGIALEQIMSWYHEGRAPFGPGKRKEFPDAFAVASLLSFARSHQIHVGVLSGDGDFQNACSLHNELLYFKSIGALTEALLGEESRVLLLKELLGSDSGPLVDAIGSAFTELNFVLDREPLGEVSDVEVQNVELEELNAIHLGDREATVAFTTGVEFSARIEIAHDAEYWGDHDDDEQNSNEWPFARRRTERVTTSRSISGAAKVALAPDDKAIGSIVKVAFDLTDVPIRRRRRQGWRTTPEGRRIRGIK